LYSQINQLRYFVDYRDLEKCRDFDMGRVTG